MKITRDEILKKVKILVKEYYKKVENRPFLRRVSDNDHLSAFKGKKINHVESIELQAYNSLFVLNK